MSISGERSFQERIEEKFGSFRVSANISFKLDRRTENVVLTGKGRLEDFYGRSQEAEFSVGPLTSDRLAREPQKALLGFIGKEKGVEEKYLEVGRFEITLDYSKLLQAYQNKDSKWIQKMENEINYSTQTIIKSRLNSSNNNNFILLSERGRESVQVKFTIDSVTTY